MFNVYCDGSEDFIHQCSFTKTNSCSHNEDVVVICSSSNMTSVNNYRLANPVNITTKSPMGYSSKNGTFKGVWGRLEKYNNSLQIWTQVCDDEFSDLSAKVACKTLNLPSKNVAWANSEEISNYLGEIVSLQRNGYNYMNKNCTG